MRPVPPGHIVLVDGAPLRNAIGTDLYRAFCTERDASGDVVREPDGKLRLIEFVGLVEVVPEAEFQARLAARPRPPRP
jgi:hypothetical protein